MRLRSVSTQTGSISTRTMLVLLSVSILIILVLGGLWLITTKQSIENDLYSTDIQDARHMAESVNMYLDDIAHNVEIVATDPYTIESFNSHDSGRLMQVLDNLNRSVPSPNASIIIDSNGDVVYSTNPLHIKSIASDPWYSEMVRSNGTYITGLYKSVTLNENAFAVLTPIKNNDSIMGRMMLVFTPENLQDSLKAHNLDPRDNIIVVDGNGNVISSNDLGTIGRGLNLSSYSPVKDVIGGNAGLITHTDSWDNQPRISAYQPVSASTWGVIVSTPIRVEYQQLNDLLGWILGVLIISVVAVSVLGYFAARYLTRPILDLSGTMRRVSGGEHDLRAAAFRNDEIGELAGTFNRMMDRLVDARAQSEMYLDLMGHDINNMNQVAVGYLQMAEDQIESGVPVEKENEILIRKPLEALENSTMLIENIRKLRRSKTEEMRTGTVDITTVLAELKEQYSHVPGRKIQINLSGPGKCEVAANDLIKDLFSNLIWNAIKHSDGEKPLNISLTVTRKEDNGRAFFEVAIEDNGPGITDEMKARIFLRFSQGQTKAKGSGLGLFLVKSLAESYHGEVWVEDRVNGDYSQGCRFVVRLPSL